MDEQQKEEASSSPTPSPIMSSTTRPPAPEEQQEQQQQHKPGNESNVEKLSDNRGKSCYQRADDILDGMATGSNFFAYFGRLFFICMTMFGIALSVSSLSSCKFISRTYQVAPSTVADSEGNTTTTTNANIVSDIGLFRYASDPTTDQCVKFDSNFIATHDHKHHGAQLYSMCAPVIAFIAIIVTLLECCLKTNEWLFAATALLMVSATLSQGLTMLMLQSHLICGISFECHLDEGGLLSMYALGAYILNAFGIVILPRPQSKLFQLAARAATELPVRILDKVTEMEEAHNSEEDDGDDSVANIYNQPLSMVRAQSNGEVSELTQSSAPRIARRKREEQQLPTEHINAATNDMYLIFRPENGGGSTQYDHNGNVVAGAKETAGKKTLHSRKKSSKRFNVVDMTGSMQKSHPLSPIGEENNIEDDDNDDNNNGDATASQPSDEDSGIFEA